MDFTPVPPEDVDKIWDRVGPLLQLPVDVTEGRYTLEKLKHDIQTNMKILWIMFDGDDELKAALTTSVEDYSKDLRVLRIAFLGGEDFLEHIDLPHGKLREFAKQIGCTKLEMLGRFGWKKILEKRNFKISYICMEEDV